MKKILAAVLMGASAFATQALAQAYGAPITLDQARKAMAAAQAEAKKNNWNFSVAILDNGGHMVLFERSDGAFFASADVARDKAWSAAAFRRPGKAFQDRLATGGIEIRLLQLRGASPLDGGEPLIVDGKVVGSIGVSGGSGEQDGQVARAGVAALK